MAAADQKVVGNLFKTLGARLAEAHNAAKDVPINVGGGNSLPGGINNGIFKLTTVEFIEGKKEEDKGKYYCRFAATVKSPEYHDGIKCRGKQDSKLVPFFDTPKREKVKTFLPVEMPDGTKSGHWLTFRDMMSALGITPPPEQQAGESKEAASARIQQYYMGAIQILNDPAKPVFFEFRTWQPPAATEGKYKGKTSDVMVFWNARCEYQDVVNPAAGMTPAPPPPMSPPSTNGQHQSPTPPPAAPPAAMAPEPFNEFGTPAAAPPATAAVEVPADGDLDDLATIADSDPEKLTDEAKDAVRKLSKACAAVGVTDEDTSKVDDWAGVVGLIRGKSAAQPTATKVEPVKGATVVYQGKPCEVTSANPEAKTATLRVVADKKSVMGPDGKLLKVPFAELS